MNRILFEKDEIANGLVTFGGARAEHVLNVLHGEVGQILKTGEVNGPIGTGEIVGIEKVRVKGEGEQRTDNNSIVHLSSSPSPLVTVRVLHAEQSLAPWVDVILAPPRPRVMKRLLPQLAAMGVGRIILVGAEKVEKDFWGATLLKEENYRLLLIDGLMQCGTSILPTLETWKSFNRFLREGLPTFTHERRIVAHPYGEEKVRVASCELRVKDGSTSFRTASAPDAAAREARAVRGERCNSATQPTTHNPQPRTLLAIGPEGGWTDAEVEKLEAAGFVRYSLGPRILRTDTATIALLAQLMEREAG